jgi:hypothetical protein
MSDMSLFLQAGDFVGVSFWIVSVAMVAATVFFFYEGMAVNKEWRLSMTVSRELLILQLSIDISTG